MFRRIRVTVSHFGSGIVKMFRNGHITIRKGAPADSRDFAELVLLSSPCLFPALYGNNVDSLLQRLYRRPRHLFSHEHTYFAELTGKTAGMLLGYSWRDRKREDLRTGLLLLREMKLNFFLKLPAFIRSWRAIGAVREGEYYISNVATYARHQSTGVGTRLIGEAEKEAAGIGARVLALDVETENSGAIRLYRKLGFSIENESSLRLGRERLRFYRMTRKL
jgi:ribosomal protein S18 acetylase RimI-like enzyme